MKGEEKEEYAKAHCQRGSSTGCKVISGRVAEGSFGAGHLNGQ